MWQKGRLVARGPCLGLAEDSDLLTSSLPRLSEVNRGEAPLFHPGDGLGSKPISALLVHRPLALSPGHRRDRPRVQAVVTTATGGPGWVSTDSRLRSHLDLPPCRLEAWDHLPDLCAWKLLEKWVDG